jgi:hypothetical protein
LQQYYFDHYSPEQIAKHIHGFVAAKKVRSRHYFSIAVPGKYG